MYNKKVNKILKMNKDIWGEEQFEQYAKVLYGMDFIAGYTENGMPYGIITDEENSEISISEKEELPFQ